MTALHRLREELTGRNLILLVDNEAAWSSLTEGAGLRDAVRGLLYSLWTAAALFNMNRWVERVSTRVNPAGSRLGGNTEARVHLWWPEATRKTSFK